MFRTLLCSFALFGFGAAASAGELDRDTAQKAIPAKVAASPMATPTGTELDQESPQSAYRGHGGWGYGHSHGYGGRAYGNNYGYSGWGYGGVSYRPYYGGRGYSSYYGGFSGGFYRSFNTGFYPQIYPSYLGSYASYGFAPYGCYNSIWY